MIYHPFRGLNATSILLQKGTQFMRVFAIAGAVLMLFATTASAAELSVAGPTLESMGLGGMQQLSDSEGRQVRGQGLGDVFLGAALGQIDLLINDGITSAGGGEIVGHINLSDMVLGNMDGFDDFGGIGGGFGGLGGGLGGFGGGLGGGFNFGGFSNF